MLNLKNVLPSQKKIAITFSLRVLGQKPKSAVKNSDPGDTKAWPRKFIKLATLCSAIDKKFSVVDSTGT